MLANKSREAVTDTDQAAQLLMAEDLSDIVDQIITTNAYQSMGCLMVFRLASRFNHSCEPPAKVVVKGTREPYLQILQAVECGAEVTVSYINEKQDYAARQALLQKWGFVCTCERCKRDETPAATSGRSARRR